MTNKPEQKSALDTSKQDIKAGNFTQDLVVKSGKIAIIDAALLDGVRNPLVEQAIIVPVKYVDATLEVKGEFDDAILRSLSITPKRDSEGNVVPASAADDEDVEVIKPKKSVPKGDEVEESLMSKDPPLQRKIRALNGNQKTKDHLSGKARSNRNRGPRIGHDRQPEARIAQAVKRKGHVNRSGQRVKAKRQVPEDVQQIYNFIAETIKKPDITVEDIKTINNKPLFKSIVNKMFYMSLGGWTEDHGTIKHTLGETVNSNIWTARGGILYSRETGRRPNIDFTWAYNARNAIKDFIVEENKNLNVDSIMEGIRNAGRNKPIIG